MVYVNLKNYIIEWFHYPLIYLFGKLNDYIILCKDNYL